MVLERMPYLEAERWNGYHTYLTVFLALGSFFNTFTLIFSGLILNQIAISFSWNPNDILIVFSIISIGGLFTIIPHYLTDRFGRKPLILLMNILFYTSIIGSAFAPDTLIFIIFQIIASIFGIDLYAVWISEEIPAQYREKAIGVVSGISMSSAILAGYLLIFTGLSEDMWRYLYSAISLGAIIIITILWVKIKETRLFLHSKQKAELEIEIDTYNNGNGSRFSKRSLFMIFQRKYLKILILSVALIFLTDWIYLTIKRYFVVFLLIERPNLSLNEEMLGILTILVYIGSILGYYFSGYFSNKVGGNKRAIYISILMYFAGSLMFLFDYNMYIVFIGLFIVNLSYAFYRLIIEILAEIFFPTKIRTTGNGWVYLFASAIGIGSNFTMYFLLNIIGEWALMFFIIGTICLIALGLVTHFIPETNGRSVEEIYITEIENNGHKHQEIIPPTPMEFIISSLMPEKVENLENQTSLEEIYATT